VAKVFGIRNPFFFIFRKHLSLDDLAKKIAKIFAKAADPRDRSKVQIRLTDALMSAFAMFSLKIPSLLAFDNFRSRAVQEKNLMNLFGIETIPSDTSMREILDEVDPDLLRPAFKEVFFQLQRGKALEVYQYIDGYYLVAIDGTGYFSSKNIHCKSCCEKHNKATGEVTYQHQMLGAVLIHPDQKQVIPFCPEPIIKQDGEKKNDCERNAAKRMIEWLSKEHPKLKMIITEDGISSNAPHIRDLKAQGMSFILGAKPGDHKFLFDEFDLAGSRCKQNVKREGKIVHIFRYVNDLQLNESSDDVRINFLHYTECRPDGSDLTFSWVTDIEINDDNVYKIMRGGRARWKIENETFNTLKNQGYEFEHNYGHGYKNLSVVFAFLMMLAFLIDQAQLLTCNVVQTAVKKKKRLGAYYQTIREIFNFFIFESWAEVYSAIAYDIQAINAKDVLNRPNSS
jgi:hypothetical protein